MKRTKQRGDRNGQNIPEHVSGCRQFEGEDLLYHDRMLKNAELQKDWATQQVREKRQSAAAEKEEDDAYAHQTEVITRMRNMLEDEAAMKRAMMAKALQEENKRMALEKRQREENWKNDQQHQNMLEVTLTNHHESLDQDGKITRQA